MWIFHFKYKLSKKIYHYIFNNTLKLKCLDISNI